MNTLKRAVLGAGAVLLLTSILPAEIASAGGDNGCYKFLRSERGFARKINAARNDGDLGRLHLDPELSKAAKVHTREMVRKEQLYHTPDDKLSRRVTSWTVLGENVGVGGGVRSLHKAFMNSPAHRANVMYSTFRHVGVGVVRKDDQMWVTIIFEAVTNPGTTLSMPSC